MLTNIILVKIIQLLPSVNYDDNIVHNYIQLTKLLNCALTINLQINF